MLYLMLYFDIQYIEISIITSDSIGIFNWQCIINKGIECILWHYFEV